MFFRNDEPIEKIAAKPYKDDASLNTNLGKNEEQQFGKSPTTQPSNFGFFNRQKELDTPSNVSKLEREIQENYPYLANLEVQIAARMVYFMDKINKARGLGHVVYPEDILSKLDWEHNLKQAKEQLALIVEDYDFRAPSLVNETFFERVQDKHGFIPFTYRLKSFVSASEALQSLLTEGVTLLDCETTIQFSRYLTILSLLKNRYGKVIGSNIFDHLFGHKDAEIPEQRRALFCHVNPLMSLSFMNQETWRIFPLHPLAYFLCKPGDPYGARITGQTLGNMNCRGLIPGDQICFQNMELYIRKHSVIAPEYGLNVIFCWHNQLLNQDQYTFFGAASKACRYDEIAILDYLRQEFNKLPPSYIKYFVSNLNYYASADAKQKRMEEFSCMQTIEISYEKIFNIPGLQMDCRIAFDIDKFAQLLTLKVGEEKEIGSKINAFLLNQEWLMKRKRLDEYLRKKNITNVILDNKTNYSGCKTATDNEKYFQSQLDYIERLIKLYPDCMSLTNFSCVESKPYSPAIIEKLRLGLAKNPKATIPEKSTSNSYADFRRTI